MNKVCVVGLGYIGLPTSIIAAEHGFNVVGLDVDRQRVERINNCDPVIREPEIFERLQPVVTKKLFRATHTIEVADCFIIAVPTPFTNDKKADLSFVFSAAKTIAAVLKKGDVIILESTVPVGTTQQMADLIEQQTELRAGIDFFVAHCPERVLPGKIFKELVHNARIIGGINPASVDHAKKFYKKFVKGPLYLTNMTTAEMVKLVENSSRDVAIAFANQVASMAYAVGLDPYEVIELANKHPRVNILNPGCGVGGHCIAVDPWFLVEGFPQQTSLLKTARKVNDAKPHEVVEHVKQQIQHWKKTNEGAPKILVLGLTYKADVDDLRESPALEITQQLEREPDVTLMVSEPMVERSRIIQKIKSPMVEVKEGLLLADIIVCLVAHTVFKDEVAVTTSQKIVIDSCGLLYKARKDSAEQEKLFWPASSQSKQSWGAFMQTSSVHEQEKAA